MNFVKLNAIQNADDGSFMKLEAEAVTRGILDDDNGVILYGEYAGFKVMIKGVIPDPVYLSEGNVEDALADSEIAFAIVVEDPEGYTALYIPGVKDSKAVWTVQS